MPDFKAKMHLIRFLIAVAFKELTSNFLRGGRGVAGGEGKGEGGTEGMNRTKEGRKEMREGEGWASEKY